FQAEDGIRGFHVTGVQTCALPISDAHLEERIESMVRSERPDVLVLSVVDYITGLKVDLDFIKQLKEQFPDLLIVGDATQYLGTEPFDFSTSGFDAVGASGYKWLLAGFSNGLLFLSNSMKENLYVEAQRSEEHT